jgi:hypothetical protein
MLSSAACNAAETLAHLGGDQGFAMVSCDDSMMAGACFWLCKGSTLRSWRLGHLPDLVSATHTFSSGHAGYRWLRPLLEFHVRSFYMSAIIVAGVLATVTTLSKVVFRFF